MLGAAKGWLDICWAHRSGLVLTKERPALPWGLRLATTQVPPEQLAISCPLLGLGCGSLAAEANNTNLPNLHQACSPKRLHPRCGRWRGYCSQLGYWPPQTPLQPGVPGGFAYIIQVSGVKGIGISSRLRLGPTLEMIQSSGVGLLKGSISCL